MQVTHEPRAAWLTRLLRQVRRNGRKEPSGLLVLVGLALVAIWVGIVFLAYSITGDSPWLWVGVVIASTAVWALHAAIVEGLSFEELESRFGAGVLVLGVFAAFFGLIGALVFFFLGVHKQRELYFKVFPGVSIPQGIYVPIRITSNTLENRAYVLTFEGDGDVRMLDSNRVQDLEGIFGLFAEDNLRFKGECEPQFWNRCDSLLPGRLYCARWVSSDWHRIAIGPAEGGERCRPAPSETAIYTITGWTDRSQLTR